MAIRVSAIVSVYNADKYLKGRLDDLLAQTLWERNELEIVLVNSGSTDGSAHVLRDYLRRYPALKVISTLREGIYSAWNRGIRFASGALVVNANCDDRLAPTCYERLAETLDAHPDVDVVYADSWVTDTENGTWRDFKLSTAPPYTTGTLNQIDYDPRQLGSFYFLGQTPMWRKALHDEYGYFDESFLLSGDYEFALRLAAHGVNMLHVPEPLALFYYGNNSTTLNQDQSNMEARRALLRWREYLGTPVPT